MAAVCYFLLLFFLRDCFAILCLVFCAVTRLCAVVCNIVEGEEEGEEEGVVTLSGVEDWKNVSSVGVGGLSLGGFRPNAACTSSQSPTISISTLLVAKARSMTGAASTAFKFIRLSMMKEFSLGSFS